MRELLITDVDDMFELDSNPEVHKYLGKNPINTKAQAEAAIAFIRTQYLERGIGRFATIEKSSGNFIGWSGLKLNTGEIETLGTKKEFYDIGYRFMPKYWGKGYATESSIAVLDYGFQNLKLDLICGAAETGNTASNAILQKIGLQYIEQFPYESEMVNWYELKKEDYAKTMS